MIKIRNLKLAYDSRDILTVENLELTSGIFLLDGKNGSGKTTLLNFISGVESMGLKSKCDIFDVSGTLIYISPQLWNESSLTEPELFDKVTFVNNIKTARTYEFINEDIPINSCSTGQKKLAILNLAIHLNPTILLLDEPFENLDDGNNELLLNSINARNTGDTITIVTTHINEYKELFDEKIKIIDDKILYIQ